MAKQARMPLIIANFGVKDTERKSKLYKRLGRDLGSTILLGDTKEFCGVKLWVDFVDRTQTSTSTQTTGFAPYIEDMIKTS